mmetsp:Transcript_25252/g.41547  ORF Transcript_25252/g.41547 Transcript_25252/m.41547 type:complete len:109 (-) Transcript_25252:739-1065(-)
MRRHLECVLGESTYHAYQINKVDYGDQLRLRLEGSIDWAVDPGDNTDDQGGGSGSGSVTTKASSDSCYHATITSQFNGQQDTYMNTTVQTLQATCPISLQFNNIYFLN